MQTIIITLHSYNAYLVMLAGAVAGIWGLVLFFLKREMNKPLRIAMIATAIVGLLQGLLGATLAALSLKPGGGVGLYYLHYVYGAIVALALPVGLTYTSNDKPRRNLLVFSIAAIILAAAGVRAWLTGPAH